MLPREQRFNGSPIARARSEGLRLGAPNIARRSHGLETADPPSAQMVEAAASARQSRGRELDQVVQMMGLALHRQLTQPLAVGRKVAAQQLPFAK